jgi:Ca2+-binding EF-hand superfamily protein
MKRKNSLTLQKRPTSIYEKVRESDIEACARIFESFDVKKRGYLDFFDLKLALEKMGVKFSHPYVYHKMISENYGGTGKVSCFEFTKIVVEHTKEIEDESNDILDAFVAMGGDEDGGGNIDADRLTSIIKDELEMTIDIEGLIKAVDDDNSGEIEYEEFVTLLESDGDNPEIETFKDWFCF